MCLVTDSRTSHYEEMDVSTNTFSLIALNEHSRCSVVLIKVLSFEASCRKDTSVTCMVDIILLHLNFRRGSDINMPRFRQSVACVYHCSKIYLSMVYHTAHRMYSRFWRSPSPKRGDVGRLSLQDVQSISNNSILRCTTKPLAQICFARRLQSSSRYLNSSSSRQCFRRRP